MLDPASVAIQEVKAAALSPLLKAHRSVATVSGRLASGPRPSGLSAGSQAARWVAWDGHLNGDTGSVDLLWIDQELEFLWPEQAADFLREVRRVLKPDGLLVLAGTNREVAAKARRPARALELTWVGAAELLHAAGFDLTRGRGFGLVRWADGSATKGARHSKDPLLESIYRAIVAADAPEGSLVWWAEARRSPRDPAPETVETLLRRAEAAARAAAEGSTKSRGVVDLQKGQRETLAIHGPLPLRAGRYRATLDVRRAGVMEARTHLGDIRVIGDDARIVFERRVIAGDLAKGAWNPVAASFDLPEPVEECSVLFISTGAADLSLRSAEALTSVHWRPAEP